MGRVATGFETESFCGHVALPRLLGLPRTGARRAFPCHVTAKWFGLQGGLLQTWPGLSFPPGCSREEFQGVCLTHSERSGLLN